MSSQKSDAGGEDVAVPVENEAFMNDFFAQVVSFFPFCLGNPVSFSFLHVCLG